MSIRLSFSSSGFNNNKDRLLSTYHLCKATCNPPVTLMLPCEVQGTLSDKLLEAQRDGSQGHGPLGGLWARFWGCCYFHFPFHLPFLFQLGKMGFAMSSSALLVTYHYYFRLRKKITKALIFMAHFHHHPLGSNFFHYQDAVKKSNPRCSKPLLISWTREFWESPVPLCFLWEFPV